MQLKYLFAFIFLFTAFIFTDFSAQNLSNYNTPANLDHLTN